MTDDPDSKRTGTRTPDEAWEALEAQRDLDEAERLMALSDAQLDHALEQQGVDPAHARALGVRAAREASERAKKVVPLRPRGTQATQATHATRWVAWAAAAAVAAVVALVIARRRDAIEAWFKPDEIRADDGGLPWPVEPTPQQKAKKLRGEAYAACSEGRWGTCATELDDAQRLDPAGEADPRVQQTRQAIESALHPEGGADRYDRKK